MADEMISLERLSDYNNNILRDANILKRKTSYVLNNVVNKGQVYLKCTQAGTTDIITLPLSNVQIGDILTDGTVKWEVISLNGAGAGSGNGLQDWKPQTEYHIDDNFVYENEIYKVRVKFTSGDNFENTQLMEEYIPIAWKDNHAYNVGDIFVENNVFYKVINAYTSGASFEVTSDIEVYTPIIFSNKESISIGDIVKYSTNYYKALQNFVCGDTFSLYVFEKYIPHELTEKEIRDIIRNFTPEYHAIYASSGNPVGTILHFMGTIPPTDYLACDGTIYNIDDYPLLATHINIQFGSYNYFGGDGTTTFAVPDLRGEFLRGTGTNSHANQGNGANVGVHQDSTEHNIFVPSDIQGNNLQIRGIDGSTYQQLDTNNRDSVISSNKYQNFTASSNGGSSQIADGYYTSRPTNTSVLYCIKYK